MSSGPTQDATAVIAAAGSGTRLGTGGPKAFVEVAGKSLLERSLVAVASAGSITAVVVAAPPETIGETQDLVDRLQAAGDGRLSGDLTVTVVSGGTERSESVANAMKVVETDLVVVNDAARPFLTAEMVDGVVAQLAEDQECASVIAAARVTDTIKQTAEGGTTVAETLDRSRLWAVQTPQAFRSAILREALADPAAVAAATDDAMLVESLGHRVEIFETTAANFKVTTPHDLHIAELILG